MNIAVSDFVGTGLLAKLQAEAARGVKNGDKFALVRQLEYFRLRYNECKCEPAHSCGGCEVLYEIGLALKELTAAQRDGPEATRAEHEGEKSRGLWFAARSDVGAELAKITERVRRLKLSAQERKAEDEDKKRQPPPARQYREDQMEIES